MKICVPILLVQLRFCLRYLKKPSCIYYTLCPPGAYISTSRATSVCCEAEQVYTYYELQDPLGRVVNTRPTFTHANGHSCVRAQFNNGASQGRKFLAALKYTQKHSGHSKCKVLTRSAYFQRRFRFCFRYLKMPWSI